MGAGACSRRVHFIHYVLCVREHVACACSRMSVHARHAHVYLCLRAHMR